MLFPETFIDEIKHRVPLSKVIGKKVALKKNGLAHKGLCPFHKEKTPSFVVYDHKSMYYCFGCHASGDAISYLQQSEKHSFEEAIKTLAEIAGIELPKKSKELEQQEKKKLAIIDVVESASIWFQKQLQLSTNHTALEYFTKRGLDAADIKNFSLGFAPYKGLLTFLQKEGANLNLIVEAGLAIKTDDGGYIERFRNRIMFPIKNSRNQTVGFGGRALDNEVMPKYLNSPETEIFKKNKLLYCGEKATKNALKNERIIVVEGYMDAIFMHKAGFTETVATLGTAFNQMHLQILWKIADDPILCFDGDSAGKKAMTKAAYTALPIINPGQTLKFCFLPNELDPDDTLKQLGANFMGQLLDKSTGLADFIWQNEFEQSNLKTPEGKAFFEHKMNDLFKTIVNPVVKNHYLQFLKTKIWEEFSPKFKTKLTVRKRNNLNLTDMSTFERLEYGLFAQILNNIEILNNEEVHDDFIKLEIENEELEILRDCLLKSFENKDTELKELLNENNLGKLFEFLCGDHSVFINKISENNPQMCKEIWLITYKKYLLENLKKEYSDMMQKALDGKKIYEKAMELKLVMDELITEILNRENNLI